MIQEYSDEQIRIFIEECTAYSACHVGNIGKEFEAFSSSGVEFKDVFTKIAFFLNSLSDGNYQAFKNSYIIKVANV